MGRRAPDPRPSIEVVGAEPELTSVQRVEVGPKGPRRPSGRGWAVGAGIGVLLLGGLVLGQDDEGPTSPAARQERDNRDRAGDQVDTTTTSRPGSTTTRPPTTTTTIPVGPVFGQPTGGSLLAYSAGRWRLVDLDSGARRELDLPGEYAYDSRVVPGGLVVLAGSPRMAQYHDLRAGAEGVPPVVLGRADLLVSAEVRDQVWLIDTGGQFEGQGSTATADVRLVDLSGEVLRSFEVPSDYVVGAFDGGLVIVRGGRAYRVDEAGVRPIAVGEVLGTTRDHLILFSCDDRAECGVRLHPASGDTSAPLDGLAGLYNFGYGVVAGAEGPFAILRYPGNTGDGGMSFFAGDGQPLGETGEGAMLSFNGEPRWLPGDLGMVMPGANGGIDWIHRVSDEWVVESDVAALAGLSAEVLVVIQP